MTRIANPKKIFFVFETLRHCEVDKSFLWQQILCQSTVYGLRFARIEILTQLRERILWRVDRYSHKKS